MSISRHQKTPRDTRDKVAAVRVDERHQAALAQFFKEAWAAPAPAPDPAAPAFALLVDGRMVGYIGTLPVRFWDGAREHRGHWMKGFMVLPEYRNGGVGFLVLKRALQELPVVGSLSVAPPARRLFTAAGFHESGTLSNQITLLRPARVLSVLDPEGLGLSLPPSLVTLARAAQRSGIAALLGAGVAALLALWRLPSRLDFWRRDTRAERPDSVALDRLWLRLRGLIPAGVVRDGAHFARYGDEYRFVTAHDGPALEGIAVIRLPRSDGDPRLRGIRVAVLSEVLAAPSNSRALRALLRAAESAAREAGADALLCSASHASLQRRLARQGYLPFPGNVCLLLRGLPDQEDRAFSDWWLTRGDGHADEVF